MMLDYLITLIEREIAIIENILITGGCPDYTVYREQVAALNAFRSAIELAKKAFHEDGDE